MANKNVYSQEQEIVTGNRVVSKYLDNGDGTYSQAVAITNVEPVYVSVGTSVEVSNDLGNPLPINAVQRACVGRQTLSVTTGSVATLTVPVGAVAALLQVDGASPVSLTLDGTTNPTSTIGTRLDDGIFYYVDTALANVKLLARTGTVNIQITYFDKV